MNSIYSFQSIIAEFRQSMRLSLPLFAAQLIYALDGFIITAMIAHLGRDALAANALVWGIFITLILFFIGILNAVSILVGQSYGSKDQKGVQKAANQGFILAMIFAIPMMLIMWIAPTILILAGQNPTLIKLAVPYFHSLSWCMLPLNFLIVLEQFLIGISRTRLVLFMSIIEVPIEILCFYALMFGNLGMPHCGLSSIGYGITVATSVIVIIIGGFIHFSSQTRQYKLFENFFHFNKKYITELIRIGLPLGSMYCIEVALFTAMAFMIGHFGKDALAAHNIAYQCFIFTITIISGIGQSATVRVSYEVGRNNRDAVKLAAYTNMAIGFCFMAVLAFCYIKFPLAIIGVYINIHAREYQPLIHYATTFLCIASLLQLTDCFRLIATSALRGLKDTKFPFFISLLFFWPVVVPSAYLLAFVFHLGGAGIWWALFIGLSIGAVILFTRFNRLVKKVDLTALVTK